MRYIHPWKAASQEQRKTAERLQFLVDERNKKKEIVKVTDLHSVGQLASGTTLCREKPIIINQRLE